MPENPQFIPETLSRSPHPRHFVQRLKENWEIIASIAVVGEVILACALVATQTFEPGIIIAAGTVLAVTAAVIGAARS